MWWFVLLIVISLVECVLTSVVNTKTQDKNKAILAAACFNLVAGLVICAVLYFDMQMLQIDGYYVEDIEETKSSVIIELSNHGFDCLVMLILGAVQTAMGFAGIAFAFYRKLDQCSSGDNLQGNNWNNNYKMPETNQNIKNFESQPANRYASPPVQPNIVAPATVAQGDKWFCSYCGQENKMITMQCKRCGKYKTT